MKVVDTTAMEWLPVAHSRQGAPERKVIWEGEVLPGVGIEAALVRFPEGDGALVAPRHRHDFEQIRMSFGGRQDFGQKQVLREGWVSYFPAGAPYGPERLEGGSILLIQWSNAFMTRAAHDAAIPELKKLGEFKDGIYTYIDQDGKRHNKDGMTAIWEHVFQRESKIPKPRYPQPILMNPDAFEWIKASDVYSVKLLGRFTERDVVIAKLRWDKDGPIEVPADRTYYIYVLGGELRTDAGTYGAHTTVQSGFDEADSVYAAAGTEAMCFAFPPTVLESDVFTARSMASAGSS
jgi:hypothetical protein